MSTEALIKALLCCTGSPRIKDCKERCRYFRGGDMSKCIPDMGRDVASTLESMQEELDRVKAERDAAVEDLRGKCEYCQYFRVVWNGCTPDYECPMSEQCLNNDMWQWHGLEGRRALNGGGQDDPRGI